MKSHIHFSLVAAIAMLAIGAIIGSQQVGNRAARAEARIQALEAQIKEITLRLP